MSKLSVFTSVTLDGVMQAPARSDEDRRSGFAHGGWAASYADPAMWEGRLGGDGALLLGRRTYEDFYAVWPNRPDNPFTEVLNRTQKYVASRKLKEPLPWSNSTLLRGTVTEAITELKGRRDHDLTVLGSGELVQTLMRSDLVDEYVLLIHPLILGSGRRLFPDGSPTIALALVDTKMTKTGVVIATYQRV